MLKSKRSKIAALLFIFLFLMWLLSFFIPQLTIRTYMVARLQLVSAFTSNITDMEQYDRQYGHYYRVEGLIDHATGEEIGVFYLQKKGPFWMVSSVGGAP